MRLFGRLARRSRAFARLCLDTGRDRDLGSAMLLRYFFAVVVSCAALPVAAQSLIAEYSAFVGSQDLSNSSGARLTQPWQVIRQDRANVHRFGITQPGDDWDPVFGDFNARGQLEGLLSRGFISGEASDAILRGNVRIRVRVFGQGTAPERVEVEVWNESPITAEAPSVIVPGAPPVEAVPDAVPAGAYEAIPEPEL